MRRGYLYLFGLLLATLHCGVAYGQCYMTPLFSSYESVSATGTTVNSLLQVSGYANILPANCSLPGVTHQGTADNKISTTVGWTCFLSPTKETA
jgi:hypothetical protein